MGFGPEHAYNGRKQVYLRENVNMEFIVERKEFVFWFAMLAPCFQSVSSEFPLPYLSLKSTRATVCTWEDGRKSIRLWHNDPDC